MSAFPSGGAGTIPSGMSNTPKPLSQINPSYLVHILGTDEVGNPVNILAALPAEFQLRTDATWEPLLDNQNLASSSFGANLTKFVQAQTDIALNSTYASQLIWSSTSPIEFAVRLLFNAVNDAQKEVMIPLQSLLSLTLPSPLGTGSSFVDGILGVKAPGPAIHNSSYAVNMYIGQAFYFQNVIIKNVDVTFDTMATSQGDFISASADITVSTARVYTKADFAKTFIRTNTSIPANVLS